MVRGRRAALKMGAGLAAWVAAALTGILKPGIAWSWNKAAFESKALADALKSMGATNVVESRDIMITAPDIAENGAVVPVAVTSKIPNTQTIAILAEKNPFPLAASFDVSGSGEGYVSVRLKMGQTSNVHAIVKADGKYYTAVKEVKVTIGGCG